VLGSPGLEQERNDLEFFNDKAVLASISMTSFKNRYLGEWSQGGGASVLGYDDTHETDWSDKHPGSIPDSPEAQCSFGLFWAIVRWLSSPQ
jgi:hypothetical protein